MIGSGQASRREIEDLREGGALGPDRAVLADDGGGGEVVAFDFAHQVLVHVLLPQHLVPLIDSLLLCSREGGGFDSMKQWKKRSGDFVIQTNRIVTGGDREMGRC